MFHYPLYLGIYCSSLWSRESLTLRKHYTFYFSQPLLKNLTIQSVSYTISPTFEQPLDEAVDVDLAVGHRDGPTSDFEFSVARLVDRSEVAHFGFGMEAALGLFSQSQPLLCS